MKPKLLIGTATFDDYDGVFFTVQALRMYHAEAMREVEIAVVDNNHASAHGQAVRGLLNWVRGDVAAVHYLPFPGIVGTAATRNALFKVGTAPAVVCIDSHVLLAPGAVKKLIDWYDANPDTGDLHQGPMFYDDLKSFSTHFDDVWGDDQMWGTWANMWQCPCGRSRFTPRRVNGRMEIAPGMHCVCQLPDCEWERHEQKLDELGHHRLAESDEEEPFEVPAMGLGLFTCRREAWQEFNSRFRGFGGEEWYIHEKFRRAGHRTLCLPWLRWLHRFGRPGGVKYKLDIWDKARNYVIGLTELGLPLDRARESFVGSGKIKLAHWDALVKNPDYASMATSCAGKAPPPPTLDELFGSVKATPRDLDQHADWLRALTSGRDNVVAFVKRKEWNAILAAGRPKKLTVYQKENDPFLAVVHNAVKSEQNMAYTTTVGGDADSLLIDAEECDLLVLDTVHQHDHLKAELERHAAKATRVLVRATMAFGEHDEGADGPGLLAAVREWVKEHPEWTVVEHRSEQYGMTLMSKDWADKRELPSLWQQGVNAAKASWRNGSNVLANFGPLKDDGEQDRRLALCLICPNQNNGRCGVCGCPIDRKTSWPREKCPVGKWGEV